jgi:hypothetical protein
MKRRTFLGLSIQGAIGFGLTAPLVGCEKLENILMSFQDFRPPALSIDQLGWENFLRQWEREGRELSKAVTLKHGISGYSEEFGEQLERELGIPFPPELYRGGFDYPPKTQEGLKRLDTIILQAKDILAASREKNLWYIKDDYEYMALAGINQLSPPADDQSIASVERRLNIKLPPSYKDFLRVSNGFVLGPKCRLLPVAEIAWMRDVDEYFPETFPNDKLRLLCSNAEYYKYDSSGLTALDNDALVLCSYKLLDALMLTAPGKSEEHAQAMGILPYAIGAPVPEVAQGEWEAFKLYAPRAKTFKHLMEFRYRRTIATFRHDLITGGQVW